MGRLREEVQGYQQSIQQHVQPQWHMQAALTQVGPNEKFQLAEAQQVEHAIQVQWEALLIPFLHLSADHSYE